MFDSLLKLVQEHAGDAIVKNPAIPNEKNDEAVNETTHSIINSLKNQFSGFGGSTSLTSMFGQGDGKALTKTMENNVAGDLMKKFGINNSEAGNMVSKMLPGIMDKFVSKTNDPGDKSFDLGDIMKYLK